MQHTYIKQDYIFSGGENETVVLTVATELRNNEVYIGVYVTWLYLVVMNIIPFLSLAVFNLAIYLEVRRANSERAQLTRWDMQTGRAGHQRVVNLLTCHKLPIYFGNLMTNGNN